MNEFLYFSFLQGMLAFLAPCAVALLPGYLSSFITRSTEGNASLLLRGLKLAGLIIIGFLAVYAVAGVLIMLATELIKEYMKWVAVMLGGVVVILGIAMAAGKSVSFSWHFDKRTKSETGEAFVFGIAYAIGALGCLFPLFLIVSVQAVASPFLTGLSYFLAYFLGMALLMTVTMLLSVYAKEILQHNLRKILPYVERVSGVLLVLAGIYIIQYQLVLL